MRSLRWRLTAWVAGVLLVSAAVMFVVVYRDTGDQLRGQIDRDVAGDTGQLEQSLVSLSGDSPRQVALAAGRYVRAQPFTATSTLLFAIVPGAGTASNHPELFGGSSRPDDGETAAQQARENALGRALRTPHLGYTTREVPDVGATRILERLNAHPKQRSNHRKITQSIEEKTPAFPEYSDYHASDRGAYQPCAVGHRRVDGDGVTQIVAVHTIAVSYHLDKERLPSGHVEGVDHALQGGESDDLPKSNDMGQRERGQRQRLDCRCRLCSDQELASIEPLYPDPRKRTQCE